MSESGVAPAEGASPASTEVGWNTIFFILVTLALSTMTQPVGSVLGTNPICRTYLRSSPIFCIFDTVAFLLEVGILYFSESQTWREAMATASESRFKDAPESENQEAFRMQKLVRWVSFIFGGGGCIIKLAAAKGIPWSKAFAFAYFTSFCIFEVAMKVKSESTQILDSFMRSVESRYLEALNTLMFILAAMTQHTLFVALAALSALAAVDSNYDSPEIFALLGYLGLLAGPFLLAAIAHHFIARLLITRPDIGERLLILNQREADEIRHNRFVYQDRRKSWYSIPTSIKDISTVVPLCMSVLQFFYSFVYYKFWYDPAGTEKAAWADIFG